MRKIAPLGRWLRLAVILGALGSVAVAGADVTWRLMGHDRVMPPVAVLRAPVKYATCGISGDRFKKSSRKNFRDI